MLSLRPDKRSRRVGGHAPPQRHLERSAATTKEGVNGGENARASVLRSEGVCSSVKKPRTRRRKWGSTGEKTHERATRSEGVCSPVKRKRGSRGENGLSVSDYPLSSRPSSLSPVKIKIPVASADMCRHSDTLRGAQRRRKWGLTGEKTHERATRSEGVCSSVKKPRTRRRKWGSRGENRISVANSVVFPSQKVTLSRQPFRFLRIHRWHRSSASEQRRPLRERCTAFRPLRNR